MKIHETFEMAILYMLVICQLCSVYNVQPYVDKFSLMQGYVEHTSLTSTSQRLGNITTGSTSNRQEDT